MIVGWGILSPISKYSEWAPGPVGDMATGARGWILWVSLAIMISDSIVSLAPVVTEFAFKIWIRSGIRKYKSRSVDQVISEGEIDEEEEEEVETEDRLVPTRWVRWGLGLSIVAGIIIVWAVFGGEGISPWATLIGFLMGGLLSILGCVVVILCQSFAVLNVLFKSPRFRGNGSKSSQWSGKNQPASICIHPTRQRSGQYYCWWGCRSRSSTVRIFKAT